jgi:cytochrome P450
MKLDLIYILTHYSTDPYVYKPERWLTDHQGSLEHSRKGFCAFSIGSRSCVASNMAYLELTLTLARLVYLYDMRIQPGSTLGKAKPGRRRGDHLEFRIQDWITANKDGPVVEFRTVGQSN